MSLRSLTVFVCADHKTLNNLCFSISVVAHSHSHSLKLPWSYLFDCLGSKCLNKSIKPKKNKTVYESVFQSLRSMVAGGRLMQHLCFRLN